MRVALEEGRRTIYLFMSDRLQWVNSYAWAFIR